VGELLDLLVAQQSVAFVNERPRGRETDRVLVAEGDAGRDLFVTECPLDEVRDIHGRRVSLRQHKTGGSPPPDAVDWPTEQPESGGLGNGWRPR
jgi:hypothetical protein